MSGVQIGDSLGSILGNSVTVLGNNGRPSFSTVSAMPDEGIHVEPGGNSMSDIFLRKSIGNLPAPNGAMTQPAIKPGLQLGLK